MKKVNVIVMTIVGIVMLATAILKTHQLLTEPIISSGFWESWMFFVIQIPLELGLAIWLLCGLFRKAVWLLTLISFVGFIVVTLYKSLAGFESCGCFGSVQVDPLITLVAMDIPIFLALAIFRPKGQKLLPPPWPSAKHFFSIAIPTFIILPAIVAVLVFNKPPLETEAYEVVTPQKWVQPRPVISESPTIEEPNKIAVEPNELEPIKNEWSKLDQIDIADELRSGIWVVLFYHFDCPDCKEAIPTYEEIYSSLKGNDEAIRFAFIEMPPYGNDTQQLVSQDTLCSKGRLLKKWFVTSPLIVLLFDSEVLATWEGTAPGLDELLDTTFSGTE